MGKAGKKRVVGREGYQRKRDDRRDGGIAKRWKIEIERDRKERRKRVLDR